MYDFYFGSADEIEARKEDYLLFVKRLLPRWVNSIPDSEFVAIHQVAMRLDGRPAPVMVETGIGASTFALLDVVMRTGGTLYSWDINGSKGAFLRAVLNDTLVRHYGRPLHEHWKFIAHGSTVPGIGISILEELDRTVDLCFLDSDHTLNNLLGELRLVAPRLREGSLVVIDDANYDYRHTNTAYINMQRAKVGLPPMAEPEGNRGPTFKQAVSDALCEHGFTAEPVPTSYEETYANDIFFTYFASDRRAMADKGMEKMAALADRLAAWEIKGVTA